MLVVVQISEYLLCLGRKKFTHPETVYNEIYIDGDILLDKRTRRKLISSLMSDVVKSQIGCYTEAAASLRSSLLCMCLP